MVTRKQLNNGDCNNIPILYIVWFPEPEPVIFALPKPLTIKIIIQKH